MLSFRIFVILLFAVQIDFSMAKMESVISLKTGDVAPGFSLKGIDDKMHSLEDYSKKGLLVIFMCNHCPFVKAKIDAIKELHDKFKNDISIVGINSNDSVKYPDDDFESMKAVAKEKGLEIDYLVDETQEIAKKYGAVCPRKFSRARSSAWLERSTDNRKAMSSNLIGPINLLNIFKFGV